MRCVRALVALGLFGCAVELPARPVDAPGRVLIDCGSLTPNLAVSCNDGSPPQVVQELLVAPQPLSLGETRGALTLPCALGLDEGRVVTARYRASCERPEGTIAQLVLEGHAERRCGYGAQGSAGEVRPVWRAALEAPPDAPARLRVLAERTTSAAGACVIRVGDEEVRPLAGGVTVWLGELGAGERRALVIDCSGEPMRGGLAVSSCYGYVEGAAVSPPVVDERAIVTVSVR